MFILSVITTTVLCILAGICAWNMVRFRKLRAATTGVEHLRVSVMVPARNEERCIEACVRSLCVQTHRNMEVLVLDDESSDATPAILAALQREFAHLHVIRGTPLPEGWVGKSWACHQLWQQATGDVLVFTDADTVHQPGMAAATAAEIARGDVDVFTMIPHEELGTLAEHAVIPVIHMMYFCYLPNDLILKSRSVSVSAANGQFICFSREAYVTCGGHVSVRSSLVEDVDLGRQVKRSGLRLALLDGSDFVACRMYTSAREVTEGFSKNLFPATGYNLPLTLVFLVHMVLAYIVPPVLLPFYIGSTLWPFFVIQAGIPALIRLALALRFGMPWWHAFLQPLSAVWVCVIGVNSIRWAYSRQGSSWKGRTYKQHA